MTTETLSPRWRDEPLVIVAAPGPSLTPDIAEQCRGHRTIVVQDAWRRMPWADVLYGCDAIWWKTYEGCKAFKGERWSTHDSGNNTKLQVAAAYGVRIVEGKHGDTFSTDPTVLNYGNNSGFQAVNFATLSGGRRIVLVGFDMHGTHFFGEHPKPLRNPNSFDTFIRAFGKAARELPPGVEIINATPGSDLRCFPIMALQNALRLEMAA